jgi:ComF family protein
MDRTIMWQGLHRLGMAALDVLLPPRCMICAELVPTDGTLCAGCFREMTLIGEPHCHCCGVPFLHSGQGTRPAAGGPLHCQRCTNNPPEYRQARAAWLYDKASRRLLLPLKYADRTELVKPLARQMAFAGRDLLGRAELLLPVPLHYRRLLSRKYNQAGLLARRLSKLSGVPWAPDLLRRRRATPALGGLAAGERIVALEGAFRLARGGPARIAGRRLLLVDDVMTSGATVRACAGALLAAGAASVDVLAAARVPDPTLADGADLPSRRAPLDRDWQDNDV